ncbi:MAG: hypothetical protein AB4426_03320 [Xenococcaceae cyanobacterium]
MMNAKTIQIPQETFDQLIEHLEKIAPTDAGAASLLKQLQRAKTSQVNTSQKKVQELALLRKKIWQVADDILAEGRYPTRNEVALTVSKGKTVVSPIFAEWKEAHPKLRKTDKLPIEELSRQSESSKDATKILAATAKKSQSTTPGDEEEIISASSPPILDEPSEWNNQEINEQNPVDEYLIYDCLLLMDDWISEQEIASMVGISLSETRKQLAVLENKGVQRDGNLWRQSKSETIEPITSPTQSSTTTSPTEDMKEVSPEEEQSPGITDAELASILDCSIKAVIRWRIGQSKPRGSLAQALKDWEVVGRYWKRKG